MSPGSIEARLMEEFAYSCGMVKAMPRIVCDRFGVCNVMFLEGILGGRKTVFVIIYGNLNAQGDVDNVVWPVGMSFH